MLVLVTGATGEVARGIVPALEEHFELRLLCEQALDDARAVVADIRFLDGRLQAALDGVDAVVHLAVASGHAGAYEDDAFNGHRFQVNVQGTWHVFEAARRAGVRRVVHTSSLMTVWGYAHPSYGRAAGPAAPPESTLTGEQVPGDAPPKPVGTYALTKALSEEVARYFAGAFGMEVITLRIAAPLDPQQPRWKTEAVPPQRVPFSDLARAYRLALSVPLSQFEVVTIVGESSRRIWSLEAARRVLGYEPQLRLDDLGLTLGEPFVPVTPGPYA
jgi:uronate dehydrogenase